MVQRSQGSSSRAMVQKKWACFPQQGLKLLAGTIVLACSFKRIIMMLHIHGFLDYSSQEIQSNWQGFIF